MLSVFLWATVFSIATVASIVLIGSRTLVGGEITFSRLMHILFDWHFLLGALFAFGARLSFLMINNALYKIPALSESSTTITTLITSASILFVIIANYHFLNERLNFTQGIGAFFIILGIAIITLK